VAFAKRIFLFVLLNLAVVVMVSLVLDLLNVKPYLTAYGIDYNELLIFCLVWGMAGAIISLALSRVMAKWMMGVKVIDRETKDVSKRYLLDKVYSLARKAGLSTMPEIGVYRSSEVNAFATGPTKNRSLVAVSTGLLSRMGENELDGVLAHEITHITNGDMVTMTLLQGVVNAFVMFLARVLAFAASGLGKSRDEKSSGSTLSYIFFVYLFEILFMVLGSLIVAAFSRYREFRADAGGARLAGKKSMVSALQSLKSFQQIKEPQENPAMAAFKISHSGRRGLMLLFASHPPLEERIERLHHQF
jgi:heat shock protein HtpX